MSLLWNFLGGNLENDKTYIKAINSLRVLFRIALPLYSGPDNKNVFSIFYSFEKTKNRPQCPTCKTCALKQVDFRNNTTLVGGPGLVVMVGDSCPSPDTGWTFFTLSCLKIVVFYWKSLKININGAGISHSLNMSQ